MKKKLYIRMSVISIIVMLLSIFVTVGILYGQFIQQIMEDLKTNVRILKSTEAVLEYVEKNYDPNIDNLRITVIDAEMCIRDRLLCVI